MIPLRSRSKEPLIPWAEYQKRVATEDEVNAWFQREPNANLAVVTGAISGLVVVDADGPSGLAQLAQMGLTSSTSVLTGNGKQLYFKHPGGDEWVKNAVRKYPGIDIRADGGYVVGANSIHPNGKRYVTIGPPIASTRNLPPFPQAMFANVTMKRDELSSKTSSEGWISDAFSKLGQGNRNDTFCRVVGRLHRDGWGTVDICALLSPYADQVNFSRNELAQVVGSVSRYPREVEIDNTAHSDTLEYFLQESKPVEWIVPGIIARNSLGFVAGLPETGKTWLLIDLAIEASRVGSGAHEWLGRFRVSPATVLFIDQERFKGETQRRFNAVLRSKQLSANECGNRLHIQCGTATRLDNESSFVAFCNKLSAIKPDLVIVDSFATFHTSEENDRGQIQKVLERLKQLRNEFGCAFVFIDHETKSVWNDRESGELPSAFRMAGSVGKAAAAEFVLTVRKSDAGTTVYHTKSTLGKSVDAFNVSITDCAEGGIIVAVNR